MRIKKFHGRNMRDSLEQMRRELGEEAIILSSREIHEPGNLPMTEVVAGIEPEELELHRQNRQVPAPIAFAAGERLQSRSASAEPVPAQFPEQRSGVRRSPDKAAVAPSAQLKERYQPSESRTDGILAELQQLKNLLVEKVSSHPPETSLFCPPILSTIQSELKAQGFSDTFTSAVLSELFNTGCYTTEEETRQQLRSVVAQACTTTQPIRPAENTKVVLVCGAPGSGKSSIAAKLSSTFALTMNASTLVLQPQSQSMLLPSGIQNVQAKNYASIDELNTLLSTAGEQDFIFVEVQTDRAGSEAAAVIENLRKLTAASSVLFTVAASAQSKVISEWISLCSSVPDSSVIFTQLDCCTLQGSTIEQLQSHKVSVSFVSDGRLVPQSIKAATPDRLVDSVLSLS